MVFHRLIFLQLSLLLSTLAGVSSAQVKPGCLASCGNVSIPYPFGTKQGCYLDSTFLISCVNESLPFIRESNIPVLSISTEGEIRISLDAAMDCYDGNGAQTKYFESWLGLSRFYISNTKNKFTAIGCDTQAFIQGTYGKKFYTGCMSLCDAIDQVMNDSCSGIGCCQTAIPREANMINVTLRSFSNHSGITNFSACSYAFITEEVEFRFSIEDLGILTRVRRFPVVLDWAIGNTSCKEAKMKQSTYGYACNEEENSICVDSINGSGYRCNCSEGFLGNPYLPNGCYDVDECKDPKLNNCSQNCTNTRGTYECSCYIGYQGHGRGEGGCIAIVNAAKSWTVIYIGTSAGLLFMVMVIWSIWYGIRKRKILKVREELFMQNGGSMLKKLLSENKESSKEAEAKIFTEEELKKATNNFHKGKIVGQGGFGTVYKGILADKTVAAVKKAKIVDPSQIEQFVNEVIILSQVDHDNIVKLLGCCLETPVPILVYEFITNNTLSFHLHNEGDVHSLLPWAIRLRIAIETAGALAHMHSRHIIHRDVKSANILLDDDYKAKVSDFGVSRLVPTDKTQLTTLVQGTFGYIDPEYFHSGLLNEKSDVYSFGVVLVELLTGEKVLSQDRADKDKSLAKFFDIALKEGRLLEIVPDQVKNEGPVAQITSMAEIARSCLRTKEEKRPTMTVVQRALKELERFERHSTMRTLPYPEEIRPLLLVETI